MAITLNPTSASTLPTATRETAEPATGVINQLRAAPTAAAPVNPSSAGPADGFQTAPNSSQVSGGATGPVTPDPIGASNDPRLASQTALLNAAGQQVNSYATLMHSAAAGQRLPAQQETALLSKLDPNQRQSYGTAKTISQQLGVPRPAAPNTQQKAQLAFLNKSAGQAANLATLVNATASGKPLPPKQEAQLASTLDANQQQLYGNIKNTAQQVAAATAAKQSTPAEFVKTAHLQARSMATLMESLKPGMKLSSNGEATLFARLNPAQRQLYVTSKSTAQALGAATSMGPRQQAQRAFLNKATEQANNLVTLEDSAAHGQQLTPQKEASLLATLDPQQRQQYAQVKAAVAAGGIGAL